MASWKLCSLWALTTSVLGASLDRRAEVLDGCEDAERAGLSFLQSKVHAAMQAERKTTDQDYHWASGRGNFPQYAASNHTGPFNLPESYAWQWHHPEGRFATLTYGTAMDDNGSIYLTGADGVRKFAKDGTMLWEYGSLPAEVMNAPSLHAGKVYGTDTLGHVFALDMETGKPSWKTKVTEAIGQDNGFTMAHAGVVVIACNWTKPSPNDEANQQVKGLNASTGEELWTYEPDTAVWNFLPLFLEGDQDFVFQDMTGKAYRLTLGGDLVWKAGGQPGTWTDGSGAVGPNGLVYAVHNNLPLFGSDSWHGNPEFTPGTLSAYHASTGELAWHVATPRPPNNAPAIGKVKNVEGYAVVQPLCNQVHQGAQCDIHVYDAATGGLRWVFHGPRQEHLLQAGDFEGLAEREKRGVRGMCLPNGWSAPTIDADGTVFVGHEDGNFYAMRDMDGDGVIFGPNEVSVYDMKAAFSGSSSPALSPDHLAVASCDSLFVFNVPK
mmetsp:Transcript_23618/g.44604  ORF Transcript_23618/g.44604 Transcript_23618/m.44604 type:complete len:494 (-) Transcript_23618:70-1551(-)